MNRKELEESIRQLQLLYTMSSPKAIEAIRSQIMQMEEEPEVWVPAEGVLFFDYSGQPRISSGILDDGGRLIYTCRGEVFTTKSWRRIPYLIQFTPHDGGNKRPCEDKPVHIVTGGALFSTLSPKQVMWGKVRAWAYQEDLVFE